MQCRGCFAQELETFIDLGLSPVSNDFLTFRDLSNSEPVFPLHVFVCMKCGFVQLPSGNDPEKLFKEEYVYFSSFSVSWLEHARNYADRQITFLALGPQSKVIEIASNDGYLLQYFMNSDIPVLGIEPAKSVADSAIAKGIPTQIDFFGEKLASSLVAAGEFADLMIANNVLAHVPDIHDFIKGFSMLLKSDGLATFEFPHLYNLISKSQFDTIYHEHYSYLNLNSLNPIFNKYGLKIWDVEQIDTHGGSLRLFVSHIDSKYEVSSRVSEIENLELTLDPRDVYVRQAFCNSVQRIKVDLVNEIEKFKSDGLTIAAYGAAAKGNTLLNYTGLSVTDIGFVVDLNPAKQGLFLPGTHIPVVDLDYLLQNTPDVILVLPWNLADEISLSLRKILSANVALIRAIPELEYL